MIFAAIYEPEGTYYEPEGTYYDPPAKVLVIEAASIEEAGEVLIDLADRAVISQRKCWEDNKEQMQKNGWTEDLMDKEYIRVRNSYESLKDELKPFEKHVMIFSNQIWQ